MADSRRKQIIQALLARLQAITIANGYMTDAGKQVEYGRRVLADDVVPRLALVAGEMELVEKNLAGDEIRRWHFIVAGLQNDDAAAPFALEDLVADMKRAIFRSDDLGLVGLAIGVDSIGTERVTDSEEGGSIASCEIPLAVRYREGYGQP